MVSPRVMVLSYTNPTHPPSTYTFFPLCMC
jgi:hypothetical protein